MPVSILRDRVTTALLEFLWDEWAQMGVFAASDAASPWAQDPEALLLLTLEVARSDPRLFDEVLDWLLLNESLISSRRLRTLCQDEEDLRLANSALDWVVRRSRRGRLAAASDAPTEPDELFLDVSSSAVRPDSAFLGHGLVRPEVQVSENSNPPDPRAPINLAFRLRHLLGVGARPEAVRFLLTVDAPRVTVAAASFAAGYAKRNVQEALSSLQAAGTVTLASIGSEQRVGIDKAAWAAFLDVEELPAYREWRALTWSLRSIVRWLRDPGLAEKSAYLRSSVALDLLDHLRPTLAYAGLRAPLPRGVDGAWEELEESVDALLATLSR